ncbi:hypothetical protein E2320_000593 [Naja naja]|nr:hypothetical protein E2320_000593 [Naja naja]
MYLLLIFALTFTLSTQMGAIGEEGLAQLMDCLEQECKDEEFVEIMPRVLEIIKGVNSGKAGCSLIKTFIKDGPIHDMVNMNKGKVRTTDLVEALKSAEQVVSSFCATLAIPFFHILLSSELTAV